MPLGHPGFNLERWRFTFLFRPLAWICAMSPVDPMKWPETSATQEQSFPDLFVWAGFALVLSVWQQQPRKAAENLLVLGYRNWNNTEWTLPATNLQRVIPQWASSHGEVESHKIHDDHHQHGRPEKWGHRLQHQGQWNATLAPNGTSLLSHDYAWRAFKKGFSYIKS